MSKRTKDSNTGTESSAEEPTVLSLHHRSTTQEPGEDVGELLASGDKKKFRKLSKVEGWRHTLSDYGITPFKLEGLTWQSVEHYYQAAKFKKGNSKFYKKFSAEANTNISKDPILAVAAGSPTGIYSTDTKEQHLRPDDILVDDDFFSGRGDRELRKAQNAKFSDSKYMKLLKLTEDANLVHITLSKGGKGSKVTGTVMLVELMNIRDNGAVEPDTITVTSNSGTRRFPKKEKAETVLPLPALEDRLAGHFIPKLARKSSWTDIYDDFIDFEDFGIEGDVAEHYRQEYKINIVPYVTEEHLSKVPKIVTTYDKKLDWKRLEPVTGSGIKAYNLAELKEFIDVYHLRVPPGTNRVAEYRGLIRKNKDTFK